MQCTNPFSASNLKNTKIEDSHSKTPTSIVNSPIDKPKLEEKFSLSRKDNLAPIQSKNKQNLNYNNKEYKNFNEKSNQRSDNMTFNNQNGTEKRQYANIVQTSMEKSNDNKINSVKTSMMSLNIDDSYGGSVTLEQMRLEKKKQKQIEKQNKQANPNLPPEFGESMTRLQQKIDDLTSHRRQMDEVDEEEDIVNETNIEQMRALNSKDTQIHQANLDNNNIHPNRQQKQIHDCSYEYEVDNQNVLVIDKRKLIRKDIKDAKHNVNNSSHNFEQSIDRIINFDESIQSNHSIEKNDTKIQNNSRIDMSNIQN